MSRAASGAAAAPPLEAMTRTLPLVALMFVPIASVFMASTSTSGRVSRRGGDQRCYRQWLDHQEQALTANFKRPMLNPHALIIETI
jgi:hypothetical protein